MFITQVISAKKKIIQKLQIISGLFKEAQMQGA
jgi:hypothetical protein